MILLSTILMLMVLALLVLSQMQLVMIYYQANNQLLNSHRVLRLLENEAHKVVSARSERWQASCVFHSDNPNGIILQIRHGKGCSLLIDKEPFAYLIEELGVYACMQSVRENKLYSTHQWRVTVLALGNHSQVIQLRFARLAPPLSCDPEKTVYLKPGILSWRYL